MKFYLGHRCVSMHLCAANSCIDSSQQVFLHVPERVCSLVHGRKLAEWGWRLRRLWGITPFAKHQLWAGPRLYPLHTNLSSSLGGKHSYIQPSERALKLNEVKHKLAQNHVAGNQWSKDSNECLFAPNLDSFQQVIKGYIVPIPMKLESRTEEANSWSSMPYWNWEDLRGPLL